MAPLFVTRVLGKYDVHYFQCQGCGFVRTEQPYWLDEAYSDAIAVTDTGILARNQSLAAKLACLLYFAFEPSGFFVDVAGGYGILTRMMRDYGFDYRWDDTRCPNLVARGFEAVENAGSAAAVSAFEVIEHTTDPREFVAESMRRFGAPLFIFSTITYSSSQPPGPDWWYYSPVTGQHISFFHNRTLTRLAQQLGLSFYSHGGVHIFTAEPLRNGWLASLFTSPLARALAEIVRFRMGSRTWRDHLQIVASLDQSARSINESSRAET
jgi:hypothetical protein